MLDDVTGLGNSIYVCPHAIIGTLYVLTFYVLSSVVLG